MEGEKNKLENLLHNNLMKKRDRVLHDLQEVSVADRRHKLEQYQTELEQEDEKLTNFKEQTKGRWAAQSQAKQNLNVNLCRHCWIMLSQ